MSDEIPLMSEKVGIGLVELDALMAERDRLREFAEWIVSIGGPSGTGTMGWLTMLPQILKRAREALDA